MTMNVPVPPSDGGFSSGLPGDRVMRGAIARWSASTGWVHRDGLPLPHAVLVIGLNTVLRRWKDKRPEYITEQPLPDPEELNNAIPLTEWELGLDGKPRAPWALTYVVYMVDPNTGALFTYAHDTFGAMQAYKQSRRTDCRRAHATRRVCVPNRASREASLEIAEIRDANAPASAANR